VDKFEFSLEDELGLDRGISFVLREVEEGSCRVMGGRWLETSRLKLGGRVVGRGGLLDEGSFMTFAPARPVPALNRAAEGIDGSDGGVTSPRSEVAEAPALEGIVPNSSYSRFWWSV
jgi:hypothetical protein